MKRRQNGTKKECNLFTLIELLVDGACFKSHSAKFNKV